MIQTFVFIFYLAVNLVPANTNKFLLEMQSPKDNETKLILDFVRVKDGWSVSPRSKSQEVVTFHFDKDQVFYAKEKGDGKTDKVSLLKGMNIKPNHKKWKKVTKIVFAQKVKEGEKDAAQLIFNIKKDGAKKRIIEIDKTAAPDEMRSMPAMNLSWK